MKIPKVVISYSRFLDPIFTFYCKNNPDLKKLGWNDWIPPSAKEVKERVSMYQEEWQKSGNKILKAICDITGLYFKRDVIDVHIVSGNPRQFSHPIIIKIGFTPMEFIATLTHELLHRLFAINEIEKIVPAKLLKKYAGETKPTQNHILVFAVMKEILSKILPDKEILGWLKELGNKHSTIDYQRAWEIVESTGHRELISQFRLKKN